MKTADKIIIYDDTCPMCNWYTGVFLKTGLLEKDGRQSFTEIKPELINLIDAKQCRNEIPLIDTTNNQVFYGTDALLEILGNKFPFLKKVFSLPILNKAIKVLYKLISYNRRTIVAPTTSNKGLDCTPDFNIKYRMLWILIGLSIYSLLLFPLQKNVLSHSFFSSNSLLQVQLAHVFLVSSNTIIALFLKKETAIEYLGQINMLAVMCSLFYMPLILLNKLFAVPELVNNVWLSAMLLILVKEYFRRMKFAGILKQYTTIIVTNIMCLIAFIIYLLV